MTGSVLYFPPEISTESLLEKIGEEEIFERYGVRVQTGMFRSPLRTDRHPTCRFYRRGSRLIMVDYAGYFKGDCFSLVMKKLNCSFPDALRDIAKSFGILSGSPRHPAASAVIIGPRTTCDIRINQMSWDNQHLQYWEDYGVTIPTLEKYNVVPVRRMWLNGSIYYNRDFTRKNEVVFAYKFGALDYKIYFPMRTKMRFLHNNPDILQGWSQMEEEGDFIVITKAMKDVMCLHEFDIPAIAPMSETCMISDDVLDDLKSRFKQVYALYDRDRAGHCALLNLRRRRVIPMMMPKGTTKDFSDLCKISLNSASNLVKQFNDAMITGGKLITKLKQNE